LFSLTTQGVDSTVVSLLPFHVFCSCIPWQLDSFQEALWDGADGGHGLPMKFPQRITLLTIQNYSYHSSRKSEIFLVALF